MFIINLFTCHSVRKLVLPPPPFPRSCIILCSRSGIPIFAGSEVHNCVHEQSCEPHLNQSVFAEVHSTLREMLLLTGIVMLYFSHNIKPKHVYYPMTKLDFDCNLAGPQKKGSAHRMRSAGHQLNTLFQILYVTEFFLFIVFLAYLCKLRHGCIYL